MSFSNARAQADSLHANLTAISAVITRTRAELISLRHDQEVGRACDELHAVVEGTEQATNTILSVSEAADSLARAIGARASDDATRADALTIQAQMQAIFEACTFQDLTGQRISKVVKTLVFIEERIGEMMCIWIKPIAPARSLQPIPLQPIPRATQTDRGAEAALLNGPALPGEAAVSQAAVDDMFS